MNEHAHLHIEEVLEVITHYLGFNLRWSNQPPLHFSLIMWPKYQWCFKAIISGAKNSPFRAL